MQKIDAIIDLIKTAQPVAKEQKVSFHLVLENDLWRAHVEVTDTKTRDLVHAKSVDKKTADEALDDLYDTVVSFNQTLLERIKTKLSQWLGKKPTLVKNG